MDVGSFASGIFENGVENGKENGSVYLLREIRAIA
ncbi:MAG: hypothetical protein ACJAUZ_002725 [Flavobacteriaceae bacterium]|jgi:hypothetical protein